MKIEKATREQLEKYAAETAHIEKPWSNLYWNKFKIGFSFLYPINILGFGHEELDWIKSAREIIGLADLAEVLVEAERTSWPIEAIKFTVKKRLMPPDEWTEEEQQKFNVPPNYPKKKWKNVGLSEKIDDLINKKEEYIILPEASRNAAYATAKRKNISISCKKINEAQIEIRIK